MIRVSSTVWAHWASVNPGVIAGTIDGAATNMIAARTSRIASMRFATVEATRQARDSASVSSSPAMTGMSADDSAPAATSWKMRSGIRNAAKNVSSSLVAPNVVPMTTSADPAQRPRDEEGDSDDQPGPGERAADGHRVRALLRARGWASRYAVLRRVPDTWV